MLKISIKVSFSHTNIYIDNMHTCYRYTSDVIRKHKIEFVRQYDMQYCSESTRNIWDKQYDK